jgi:hypothetical protein
MKYIRVDLLRPNPWSLLIMLASFSNNEWCIRFFSILNANESVFVVALYIRPNEPSPSFLVNKYF